MASIPRYGQRGRFRQPRKPSSFLPPVQTLPALTSSVTTGLQLTKNPAARKSANRFSAFNQTLARHNTAEKHRCCNPSRVDHAPTPFAFCSCLTALIRLRSPYVGYTQLLNVGVILQASGSSTHNLNFILAIFKANRYVTHSGNIIDMGGSGGNSFGQLQSVPSLWHLVLISSASISSGRNVE